MNSAFRSRPGIVNIVFSAVLILLDSVFLVVLLAVPLAWLGNPFLCHLGSRSLTLTWGLRLPITLVLLAVVHALIRNRAAASACPAGGLWPSPVFKRVILALCSIYVSIGLMETVLTRIGFKMDLPPIVFLEKNKAGETVVDRSGDIPDPVLIWKLNPGVMFANRRINRMGFREREVDPEKKPGTIRVICLGDSIAAQGHPGYSQYLHERLTQRPPTPQPWEAFNMGVYGYSSMQGLKLLQTRALPLKPDIVTLWYGWNDHWMCDKTDHATMAIETSGLIGPVLEALHRKRVYMLLAWMINPSRHSWRKNAERPYRVPPKAYRAALQQMIQEARAAGAIPLLITGPRRNLTESLVSKRFAHSPVEAQQVHDRYVTITREVARDTHAELLDLAALFAGPEYDSYFAADGIHYDQYGDEETIEDGARPQPGLQSIAAALDAKIREIVQSRNWQALHDSGT